MDVKFVVKFKVEVVPILKDAFQNLPAILRIEKPKFVVIFSYNSLGDSLYVRPADVVAANARIVREEENPEEDLYNPRRWILRAPALFVCDSASTVNVQAFAASSQSCVWSTYRSFYLPSND